MNHAFLGELEHEAASTRKVLALVPADKADFKPHPKSFALGPLAVHVTEMHQWIDVVLNKTELDFAKGEYQPAAFSTPEELVERFDKYIIAGKAALAATNDELMSVTWQLRHDGHVLLSMPRVQCLRSMVFNHIIHHRAQLVVYLRLLDIPVPGLYGPSADEH
jgi:uncharacterized damage-inducible protein DinB